MAQRSINITGLFIALVLIAPILYIGAHFFSFSNNELWQHLKSTRLQEYIANSAILVVSVSFISSIIGISCAWLVSRYQFWGRDLLRWALILPMALPAYIIAFTYTGMLDATGPLQTSLRAIMQWQYGEYWFPDTRSLWGACCMLSFVLYPYIYLLARTSFESQSQHIYSAARSLGLSPTATFINIALPMARPAIMAGIALVAMETLADYGTVQYFGVDTLTTGIFRTWFGMNNPQAAMQIAACLLSMALLVLLLERYSRKKSQYYDNLSNSFKPKKLSGSASVAMCFLCSTPLFLGFVIPATQLCLWAYEQTQFIDSAFYKLCVNSFWLALITALIATGIALAMHIIKRFFNSPIFKLSLIMSSLGYAIPGIVIAVGAVVIAGKIDMQLNKLLGPGLFLGGSFGLLIYVYIVRFFAAASSNIESTYSKIHPHLDEAAQSLGQSRLATIKNIHLPLIQNGILSALLIVFIDTLKELPATLVMRPFNFNTLAVRSYELASDELLAQAALPAIFIIATGIIPILLLNKASKDTRTHS